MSDSDRGMAQLVAIFIRHSNAVQNLPERHRKKCKEANKSTYVNANNEKMSQSKLKQQLKTLSELS